MSVSGNVNVRISVEQLECKVFLRHGSNYFPFTDSKVLPPGESCIQYYILNI